MVNLHKCCGLTECSPWKNIPCHFRIHFCSSQSSLQMTVKFIPKIQKQTLTQQLQSCTAVLQNNPILLVPLVRWQMKRLWSLQIQLRLLYLIRCNTPDPPYVQNWEMKLAKGEWEVVSCLTGWVYGLTPQGSSNSLWNRGKWGHTCDRAVRSATISGFPVFLSSGRSGSWGSRTSMKKRRQRSAICNTPQ